MNSIIYLVGLVVIVLAILSFVGLRWRFVANRCCSPCTCTP